MNISKGLKIKNRLSGELKRLRNEIQRNNSADAASHEAEHIRNLIIKEAETYAQLIRVRAAIQKATAPVCEKLIELSEAKARLVYLENINTKEGEYDESDRFGATAAIQKTVTYVAVISKEQKRQEVEQVRTTIENLQDEVDEYNAKTEIAV